jgi:DNA polymerase
MPKIMPNGDITYMSWRNKMWVRTKTYGGKFCENIVQAVSRDLLGHALLGVADAGFDVVLHIHDEIVAEVSKLLGLTFEQFNRIMTTKPRWAAGLPLEAEGYENERYEKR